MSFGLESPLQPGRVLVSTTDYRGWTVEEVAQRAAESPFTETARSNDR